MNFGHIYNLAMRVIKDPRGFWSSHKVGSATVAQTITSFLGPLVIAAGLVQLIKFSVLGMTLPGVGVFRAPLIPSVIGFVVSAVFMLLGYYVMAVIMHKLAPKFGGSVSIDGAFEFLALAGTASLVGAIFLIIPILGWFLALAGALYSIYIFWIGVPSQTGVSESQRLPYVAITIVLAIVFNMLTAFVRGFVVRV